MELTRNTSHPTADRRHILLPGKARFAWVPASGFDQYLRQVQLQLAGHTDEAHNYVTSILRGEGYFDGLVEESSDKEGGSEDNIEEALKCDASADLENSSMEGFSDEKEASEGSEEAPENDSSELSVMDEDSDGKVGDDIESGSERMEMDQVPETPVKKQECCTRMRWENAAIDKALQSLQGNCETSY
jgi:hypothetical protein